MYLFIYLLLVGCGNNVEVWVQCIVIVSNADDDHNNWGAVYQSVQYNVYIYNHIIMGGADW